MPSDHIDKPSSINSYLRWYRDQFSDDLSGGSTAQWYEQVTAAGVNEWSKSDFWQTLKARIEQWNLSFATQHDGYKLFEETPPLDEITTKPFESVLDKSLRWNVLNNDNWDGPPKKLVEKARADEDPDSDDPQWWYGPHNWLQNFPDIFRIRLIPTYMDGVRYLADKLKELANETTQDPPGLRFRHSNDGYHAVHVSLQHKLDIFDHDNSDPDRVTVHLEIQVTTTIQATISRMLHDVYADWRLHEPPLDWAWNYRDSAFSVNYLGSTLHYLEGMIVAARVAMEEKR